MRRFSRSERGVRGDWKSVFDIILMDRTNNISTTGKIIVLREEMRVVLEMFSA